MKAEAREPDLASLPLTALSGVGPVRAQKLAALGFENVYELLVCVPQGLRRQGELVSVQEAARRQGEELSVRGKLGAPRLHRIGRKRSLTSVELEDSTGKLRAMFFNQAWRKKELEELRKSGAEVEIYGSVMQTKTGPALGAAKLSSPEKPLPRPGTITPVYHLTEGIGQGFLQGLIGAAIEAYGARLEEPLPRAQLDELDLPPLGQAVRDLNRPSSASAFDRARRRLSLERLLGMQAALLLARESHHRNPARRVTWGAEERSQLLLELPHVPTPGQRKVIGEILEDMDAERPMGRLLQGDVGAGKTLVAQCALAAALRAGGQVCLLAPTELLAQQHQDSLGPWFRARGLDCELLCGSQPSAQRKATEKRLRSGQAQLVIGTHALFSEGIEFRRLDLVVIDEQQRFGVAQKASLLDKGQGVHVLLMTATPIPRTLALSIYGDLDVSLLTSKPPGRGSLKTHLVEADRRDKLIAFVEGRLSRGEHAFWVRPRIDETGEEAGLGDEDSPVLAAEVGVSEPPPSLADLWHELKVGPLGAHGIEVVHGRMPVEERERRLGRFRRGDAKLLLGTTIVEVGVDIPQATIMVIEGAERFGLSQLHQLRGRVGRGRGDSWCFLLGKASARDRLQVLAKTSDGFLIAEQDLRQRGMGDLGGVRQAGGNVEGLEDPVTDLGLVLLARRLVREHADLRKRYGRQSRARLV